MLHLSFDTKKTRVEVDGMVTEAAIEGYADVSKAMSVLNECLKNDLLKGLADAGFVKDENANVWRKTFSGKSECVGEDVFDARVGRNIAMTKAKAKAYQSFIKALEPLFLYMKDTFDEVMFDYIRAIVIWEEEIKGLDNAMETGWCDGKRR